MTELERSHYELRAALIVAGKHDCGLAHQSGLGADVWSRGAHGRASSGRSVGRRMARALLLIV